MTNKKIHSKISPRPEVLQAPSVPHGAPDYEELEQWGFRPQDVLDFSVNSNPYGPPPGVREALQGVPLNRYPDREALALRRALAEHLNVSPAQILAGNGAAELIWLLALAFVRPDDRVLLLGPTFGEYARAAALMGARVDMWRARAEDDFAVAPDEVSQRLQTMEPRLAFLCNPNNPTGQVVPTDVIADWAAAHPSTLFVVDEAYLAFAPGVPSALTLAADNVLVLRSMTKDYALAGLRLGYAVADEAIIDALVRVRPPWNVNAMAQAAGVAALAEDAYVSECLTRVAQAKERLVSGLRDLGLQPVPSAPHFFLVPVDDAAAFRRALMKRRVQVRDCTSFGLPAYVRIATLRPEQNERLLQAVREVLR